jgi:hypothetical protein
VRAILTPDDLKKGDLIPPGWYPAEIVDYDEKDAETDGSTNCNFYFKVIDGPSKGVTVKRLFNEKALGFGKALWAALKFPLDPVKGYELSTDLFKSTIGHKIKIYVARGKSNKGNEYNDVKDFQPLD